MATTTPNHLHHHEHVELAELVKKSLTILWNAMPPIIFLGFILYQIFSMPR